MNKIPTNDTCKGERLFIITDPDSLDSLTFDAYNCYITRTPEKVMDYLKTHCTDDRALLELRIVAVHKLKVAPREFEAEEIPMPTASSSDII